MLLSDKVVEQYAAPYAGDALINQMARELQSARQELERLRVPVSCCKNCNYWTAPVGKGTCGNESSDAYRTFAEQSCGNFVAIAPPKETA